MKTYIIHLHPQPYGFEIKANTQEEALEIAKRRWEEDPIGDYDFDAETEGHDFEVVSEM